MARHAATSALRRGPISRMRRCARGGCRPPAARR